MRASYAGHHEHRVQAAHRLDIESQTRSDEVKHTRKQLKKWVTDWREGEFLA
jgi:hypothetical protein